jgi:hypothetical protein
MWKAEILSHPYGWLSIYEGRLEQRAREEFTRIEAECASNQRGHTEVKLWNGEALLLHIYWNRGVPNKPDGTRDWSR